jgi:hypothetical protein
MSNPQMITDGESPAQLGALLVEHTPQLCASVGIGGVFVSSVGMSEDTERIEHEVAFVADSQIPALIDWLRAYQRSKKARG